MIPVAEYLTKNKRRFSILQVSYSHVKTTQIVLVQLLTTLMTHLMQTQFEDVTIITFISLSTLII